MPSSSNSCVNGRPCFWPLGTVFLLAEFDSEVGNFHRTEQGQKHTYCFPTSAVITSHLGNQKMKEKMDVWQGTLALMVLKTLDVLGSQHGYGIAKRIERTSENLLEINHGTLYPVLLKLEQEGSIESEWGVSENKRKAKFIASPRSEERNWLQKNSNGRGPTRSSRDSRLWEKRHNEARTPDDQQGPRRSAGP